MGQAVATTQNRSTGWAASPARYRRSSMRQESKLAQTAVPMVRNPRTGKRVWPLTMAAARYTSSDATTSNQDKVPPPRSAAVQSGPSGRA